jgi:hypothetical protein
MRGRSERVGGPDPRVVALSGVAAVVVILASLIAGGNTPAVDAPVARLVTFYATHMTSQMVAGALLSLGALLFLAFAATIGSILRPDGSQAPRAPAVTCVAGGVVLVAGLTILAGLSVALGDVGGQLDRPALQAIHVLSQELVFSISVGTSAFLFGAGTAGMRTGALPRWLGWLAFVLALVGAVPSHVLGGVLDHVGFAAFAGLGAWTLIVGVVLARRSGREDWSGQMSTGEKRVHADA